MPKCKKSKVWSHMRLLPDGKAMCHHCNNIIVVSGGTTNLARHLRRNHNIETQPHPAGKVMQKLFMGLSAAPAQSPTAVCETVSSTTTTSTSVSSDNNLPLPPLPSLATVASSSSASASPVTPVRVTPFTLARQARMPEYKKSMITAKVCHYIVKSLRPYHTVEDPYFRAMVHEMNPAYQLPTRHDVSERLVPAMYDAALEALKKDLSAVDYVALTGDGWTSRVADHYMTITVHYLKDWELQCKVLQTIKGEVQQTGNNITAEIDECLENFELAGRVRVMTTDNARAMLYATNKAGVTTSLGCFAHTLNLTAQKMLNVKGLQSLLGTIRPVITYFRKSYIAKLVLKEKQQALQVPCNSLVLDCKTRWNSTFFMIQRFMEQYAAIIAATLDTRIKQKPEFRKVQQLETTTVGKLDAYLKVAGLLQKMTQVMSSEKKATAGMVLPMLQMLTEHFKPGSSSKEREEEGDDDKSKEVEAFTERLKAAALEDLNKRYKDEEELDFLQEATAMDPRFKGTVKEESVWARLCEKVTVQSASIKREQEPEQESDVQRVKDEMKPIKPLKVEVKEEPKAPKTLLEEIFNDDIEITSVQPPTPVAVRAHQELGKYRQMPNLPKAGDPCQFWKGKMEELPLLAKFARQYLIAQATSVASERVFSTAGDVVSAERACLDPENVNILIFLKKNT
ncbi:hypothetical protein Bbelb_187260 [Branchiostoma belcheri]|nr:hypothetical protein Bbelb_187260 [Branchiostoma belcheri]